jgi:NADH-quinone oxidoreductase subunit J
MIDMAFHSLLAQAPAPEVTAALAPAAVLALCVVGGIGTVLLLPSRREAPLRAVGGVIVLAAALILAALLVRWAASRAGETVNVYFWLFAAIALGGALRVITHSRPVYSALYFVLTVFASAGLFLLLRAEFMAAALVLIYAGAILITYVFVIMLAAEASSAKNSNVNMLAEHDAVSRDPVIAAAVGFALMALILFIVFDRYQTLPAPRPAAANSIITGAAQELGAYLFTTQLVNLELAGLILTVAMVGAIVIARRRIEEGGVSAEPQAPDVLLGPSTPVNDNPHSIPVYGTTNPRQKAYPET